MKIIGLYSGKLSNIGEKRSPTGIFKQSVEQVSVDELGIIGDIQADKRFHGGSEKALHQYALSSYEKIRGFQSPVRHFVIMKLNACQDLPSHPS